VKEGAPGLFLTGGLSLDKEQALDMTMPNPEKLEMKMLSTEDADSIINELRHYFDGLVESLATSTDTEVLKIVDTSEVYQLDHLAAADCTTSTTLGKEVLLGVQQHQSRRADTDRLDDDYEVGTIVQVTELVDDNDEKLCFLSLGVICCWNRTSSTCEVQMFSTGQRRELCEFEVEVLFDAFLVGLRQRPELNYAHCIIISYDFLAGRAIVLLDTMEYIKVRPQSLLITEELLTTYYDTS
jgi:hypothetical protein